ncbi:hypothetical protein ACFSUS_05770 [Spirosoma soli]|uniref:Uncharacterized protein n=1 Tax=Spirosoma soli TaxID=1770529 RepID=A0ABW5M1H5_9BACT
MEKTVRIVPDQDSLMHDNLIAHMGYPKEQADKANEAFDESVKQFLRDWIENGTVAAVRSLDVEIDTDDFIEHGALRSFFKHTDDALERLLDNESIARHLLRPIDQVYFQNDAYEPLLAKFEQRIYNLAAHREHLEVPFRYSGTSRQGAHGDTVGAIDEHTGQPKEDIGTYFGTRRSDTTALNILARELRLEALLTVTLPIHVIAEGYMEDSLRVVKATAERLHEEGDRQPHCFLIQRRHAADDRHLGAALLIMNSAHPDKPQRVIFCDTLNPSGVPPWWHKFKHKLDIVFPQPEESAPVSAFLEDGGVNLQRLHDGVPVRHQDIDCAFYTYAMVRALIQLAKLDPALILTGHIKEIVSHMTARMPEYFEQANQPRHPDVVREANVVRRWNTGHEALKNRMPIKGTEQIVQEPYIAEVA